MVLFGGTQTNPQSGSAGNEETGEKMAKGAMFLAGLKILQTMNLCFAGSFPVLLRFGIPPQQIGPFIGITGSCLNFGAAMGDIIGFVFGLLNMLTFNVPAVFSIVSTGSLFIAQCILTLVCLSLHGYDGVRKYFFWLCLSALFYQGDALLCTATWGFQAAYFFLALEITNVLIPVIHFIAQMFFGWCGGKDIFFLKLCFQLGSMVFLTGGCVVLWILCYAENWDRKGCKGDVTGAGEVDPSDGSQGCQANGASDLKTAFASGKSKPWGDSGIRCSKHKQTQAALDCSDRPNPNANCGPTMSPFFMGILGMGSIFWLFPVIFPFMVCHYSHFEFTQKLNLALGAFATLIVWFINDADIFDDTKLGKIHWKFVNWSSFGQPGGSALWNWTWLCIIPVIFFTWMFFRCLHYPSGYFGRCILHTKKAVVCGCMFFFLSQLFKAIGLTGCFANAIITAKFTALGNISFMCSMIHLVASLFTNQAYSNGYSSYKSAVNSGCPWPTQGLGAFRSFCWWHRYGIRNGSKTFFGLRRIDIVAVIS